MPGAATVNTLSPSGLRDCRLSVSSVTRASLLIGGNSMRGIGQLSPSFISLQCHPLLSGSPHKVLQHNKTAGCVSQAAFLSSSSACEGPCCLARACDLPLTLQPLSYPRLAARPPGNVRRPEPPADGAYLPRPGVNHRLTSCLSLTL